MMKYETPVAGVKDGSIICFPNSIQMYMKVCDRNGHGGVVRLLDGKYIGSENLEAEKLGRFCEELYDSVHEMYCSGGGDYEMIDEKNLI